MIRFQLNVTSRTRPARGFAVLELEPAPSEPSNGSCKVVVEGNVSPVIALVTRVTVSCSDWKDHSDSASLLEYYLFINDSVGGRFHWYPVYRGSRRNVTFYLSQLHGNSGVVNLYVDVIDSLGSTRRALNASVYLSFTQPPMRRMRICCTDVFFCFFFVFFCFFPFATKIPEKRSREYG